MRLGDLLEITHNMEAVVVWAHPFHPARVGDPCLDPLEVPDAIDAVEIYSTKTKEQDAKGLRELALLRHWHVVAGSDAHSEENIGAAVTGFMKLPRDEAELASEIRQGHTSAMRLPLPNWDK
jgi:predicted metal-dependent phosphoesterase TrpH